MNDALHDMNTILTLSARAYGSTSDPDGKHTPDVFEGIIVRDIGGQLLDMLDTASEDLVEGARSLCDVLATTQESYCDTTGHPSRDRCDTDPEVSAIEDDLWKLRSASQGGVLHVITAHRRFAELLERTQKVRESFKEQHLSKEAEKCQRGLLERAIDLGGLIRNVEDAMKALPMPLTESQIEDYPYMAEVED